jgi:hypothetical protein
MLGGNPRYAKEIKRLKKLLPEHNSTWDPNSSYTFQPYFVEQKARTSGTDGKTVKVIGADR